MRRPSSLPLVRTSGTAEVMGSPVLAVTRAVMPRASLLWKPQPLLAKNSVCDHGPKISESLGLLIQALRGQWGATDADEDDAAPDWRALAFGLTSPAERGAA